MKLINQRALVRGVLYAWRHQYSDAREGSDKRAIETKLATLDLATVPAAVVDEIIGNDSWTKVPSCDECGKNAAAVVEVGQEPDYEARFVRLCEACVASSLRLFNSTTPTEAPAEGTSER